MSLAQDEFAARPREAAPCPASRSLDLARGPPVVGARGALVAADFASKRLVRERMVAGGIVPLASFFNLVSARGGGVQHVRRRRGWQRWFFVVLPAAVSAAVLACLLASKRDHLEALAYAPILGGAIGNGIDRFVLRVTDFLDLHWAGCWPDFNVAGVAICVGAACLVVCSFKRS